MLYSGRIFSDKRSDFHAKSDKVQGKVPHKEDSVMDLLCKYVNGSVWCLASVWCIPFTRGFRHKVSSISSVEHIKNTRPLNCPQLSF